MSLFGDSPPNESPVATAASKSRLSLFDDEPSPAPGSKSSLFDDNSIPGSSPWGLPTPKKAQRGDLIKSLLPASDVPDSYIDVFDHIIKEDGAAGKITAAGVAKVLSAGKLGADDQSRIISLLSSGGSLPDLGRNEFNVLLALIGLAQENEDITLDGIDERRRNLPEPQLPSLAPAPSLAMNGAADLASKPAQRPVSPSPAPLSVPTQRPRVMKKDTIDFLPEADPWGSPDMHRGHSHITTPPRTNGAVRDVVTEPQGPVRTTSNFTTASEGSNGTMNQRIDDISAAPAAGGWGTYDGNNPTPFAQPSEDPIGGGGFGGSGGGGNEQQPLLPETPTRAFGGGRVSVGGVEERIVVTLLPEKEGVFMFQHHNYHVASARRGSKVVRRYSDFVWLLDCLQKRFPFRQLPLLPPKRVGVNGSHLAADSTFIEKRRRGLARFANALVRHPVLNQEQLVIMFLTVPTHQELAVWRKQATISIQEEFVGRSLPNGLEDSLSPTLPELFERTRAGIRRSAELYINLCNLMDRLSKRNEGLAADQLRLALTLQSLTDASSDTYSTDINDVPLLNEGLQASAKHLSNSQSLLEDEAKAWDEGVLEDLKRQRDSLVSMRDMFDRRDRYDKDNIPYLERRIASNENKLSGINARSENLIKPGEIEKVTEAIIKDKESIVAQHARGVFVRECLRDELIFFQSTQYHVSRWNQDWAQERVKYAELQADNWRQLHEELESMPIGE